MRGLGVGFKPERGHLAPVIRMLPWLDVVVLELRLTGATAVFGPGTNIPAAAADLIDKLNAKMGYGPRVAAE